MIKKSQRVWIILVGLFIALMAAFAVPKKEEREVQAASFTIYSYQDLKNFRDRVNAGDSDYTRATININSDIYMTTTDNWIPIGTYSSPFRGTFNGNNHTISGMYVKIEKNDTNDGDVYAGFFGCTDGAKIQNFTIRDSFIEASTVKGNIYASGIIGGVLDNNLGTKVTGCTYDGTGGSFLSHDITACNYSQYGTVYRSHAAGLVGIAASENRAFYMSNCSVVGSPTIKSIGYISYAKSASFIGYGKISIINGCWSNAQIKCVKDSTTGDVCVGGCVGYMECGEIIDSYFVGSVNVEKNDNCDVQVGGLIGKVAPSANDDIVNLIRSYSIGSVTITTSISTKNYIGRLVGRLLASNGGTLTTNNVYYLNSSTLTPTNATIYTTGTSNNSAQFDSGEVACRLNNTSGTDPVSGGTTWYQSIDNNLNPHDNYPVLNSSRGTVYRSTTCGGISIIAYSNTNNFSSHNFENGICKKCGAYEQPGLFDGYYQINNVGNLYWFAAVVNDVDRDKCVGNPAANNSVNAKLMSNIILNNDINDTNARFWKPIGRYNGTYNYSFNGIFDGNDKMISGIKVNMTNAWTANNYTYAGFLGVASGTVKNLKITNSSVSVNCNVTTCFAGGLCGDASGTYENCDVDCSVYVNNSTGGPHGVGGMFGVLNSSGNVTGCTARGRVETASTNPGKRVGGFIGYLNSGKITDSFSTGAVIAKHANSGSEFKVGGFAGFIQGGSVEGSGTTSSVTATDNNSSTSDYQSGIGGFAGNAKDFTLIENCYAKGNVSLTSAYKGTVAGFIGFLHSSQTDSGTTYCNVKKCYALGNVIHNTSATTGACYTGGFVGDNWTQNTGASTTFENCYTWGNCTFNRTSSSGTINIFVGGFAANLSTHNNNTSYVRNCYAIGNVTATGSGTKYLGSLVGKRSNVSFSNCYTLSSNTVSVGNGYYNGTTKSLAEFESGEVTCLLNGGDGTTVVSGGTIWNQNLKSENSNNYDFYPVLDSTRKKVYNGKTCDSNNNLYTNDITFPYGHTFNDNGFCTRCGKYQNCQGNGTSDDPYIIVNAGQLYWFACVVNGDSNNRCAVSPVVNTAACSKLAADITIPEKDPLNNDLFWDPIGIYLNEQGGYTGTFDGDYKTISSLKVNRLNQIDGTQVGFFGITYNAIIKNIGIVNSSINITTTSTPSAGCIAGEIQNTSVINCYAINSIVKSECTSTNWCYPRAAGLVANVSEGSTISNCYTKNLTVESLASNSNAVAGPWSGGLASIVNGNSTVTNSYTEKNTVKVEGAEYQRVGGLIALLNGATVINCYATGDFIANPKRNTNNFIGGLIGLEEFGCVVNNTYALGNISLLGSCNKTAGKLVGYQSGGSVDNSYYCSEDSVSGITNSEDTLTTTVIGTSKLAAEFNNFAIKDLLQDYVDNNSTSSNQLSSWVQAENNPEFGWDNHQLSTTISWNSLIFGYDSSTGSWATAEDDENGNKITFVNGSTGAKLRYTAEFNSSEVSGIIGEISHTSGNWTYQGDAWPMVNSSDMTVNTNSRITILSLSGEPNISGFDNTTESSPMEIGTITLTISG